MSSIDFVKSLELLKLPLKIPNTMPGTAASKKIMATMDCMTGALKLAMFPAGSRKIESSGQSAAKSPTSIKMRIKDAM